MARECTIDFLRKVRASMKEGIHPYYKECKVTCMWYLEVAHEKRTSTRCA